MSNGDDPYIRSTISAAVLGTHAAARAEDPTVPPVAPPYWIPGGPLSVLGWWGIERRIRYASESDNDLELSFIAQDPDSSVRQAAARNPNMPRILRDAITGATGYSPEEASDIWFDVWKTDPQEFLNEHISNPGLPTVLLARGYFAEDFDDPEIARRWFRAASSIGVAQARVNLARLGAVNGNSKSGSAKKSALGEMQTKEERHFTSLLPAAVAIALLALIPIVFAYLES